MEFKRSNPVKRATWLSLMAYCASQETGGVIENCADWSDAEWLQVCGVREEEVKTTCLLYGFEGDNLVVKFYPIDQENKVKQNRLSGAKGGRPRKSQAPVSQREKPCGLPSGSDSLKRKEKKRKSKSNSNSIDNNDAERVYAAYPRKVGKQLALKSITKALSDTPAEQIIEHLKLYSESVKDKETQFIPHPSTYFNQGRHLEPVEIIQPAKKKTPAPWEL